MITFFICIALLILAYFTYGKVVEKIFAPDKNRVTPANAINDGVDFVPMSKQKNALIQLLNIAGTGPIFGPIMGALFGPIAFVWIVLGSIFAGAVHDYLTGMISIRNKGAHLPELAGRFLGKVAKHIVNIFALLLLVLVGTVFITTPAKLFVNLTNGAVALGIITAVIFIYYFLSTILPIDKIIGKVYPIFGAILLIGTLGVGASLLINGYQIPNLTPETFKNMHPAGIVIIPMLFFTITCGAMSGFHATQSPLISRTTQSESQGRYIFYGMMIAEGIIAMIWAAAAMSMFDGPVLKTLIDGGTPSVVVNEVSTTLLGAVGGTLAVLAVIVLPITSGDTAFRAARSIIADYIKFDQSKAWKRLIIAVPLFLIAFALMQIDFNILWRYFSWANQATASIALLVGTMYLFVKGKNYWISLIPGAFMTYMVFVYILYDKIGFALDLKLSYILGGVFTIALLVLFFIKGKSNKKHNLQVDLDDEELSEKETISSQETK